MGKVGSNKTPPGEGEGDPKELPLRLAQVREVVNRWWPQYWPVHEACLSTAATLLLQNVGQCVALVLVGSSGSGKGSILYGYGMSAASIFRSRFTAASILSTYGDTLRATLDERALFRVVRHRLFVCSDLNPLLKAGDREGLSRFYADLAVWLDGEGLIYDSGTHGSLGERGDFTFAMLGGATPLRQNVWKGMAELGPRLLFCQVPLTGTMVRASDYDQARDECATSVRDFLEWMTFRFPVRSQPWRDCDMETEGRILQACEVAAAGQTFGSLLTSGGDGLTRPSSQHLFQRLSTITHARALLHGRSRVSDEDVSFAERLAEASTPGTRGLVMFSLLRGNKEVPSIAQESGVPATTLYATMKDLERLGLVRPVGLKTSQLPGRPSVSWEFCSETLTT